MAYASWHVDYNKIIRDKYPEIFEAKGIKADIQVVSDQKQLILLLWEKLEEELAELDAAIKEDNMEKMLEEAADVREVRERLRQLLLTINIDLDPSFSNIVTAIGRADRNIKRYVTQENKDIEAKLAQIQLHKRTEKWWFDKWLLLISTDS